MTRGRRAALIAVPAGAFLVLAGEVLLAINGPTLPRREPFQLDGLVGPSRNAKPLDLAWLGDSVTAGVGASGPEAALPRLVAAGLSRPVRLDVFAVSGARVIDAGGEQIRRLEALTPPPDVVVVEVGANDVIHLTGIGAFRTAYRALLDRVTATGAEHVLVLGIPAFGTSPRFLQPLRAIVGWRGRQLDEEIRALAGRSRAMYVDVAGGTGGAFAADPERYYADDEFHPSDEGYVLWAEAVLAALGRVGIS